MPTSALYLPLDESIDYENKGNQGSSYQASPHIRLKNTISVTKLPPRKR
jgi:hypothetical protein